MVNPRAQELIDSLKLKTHPEGGYYKETYRSSMLLTSPQHGQQRSAVTDIYFLLLADQISRFHRVVHDELWHFYEGDPLELIEIEQQTMQATTMILGTSSAQPNYQHCIRANNWQAARSTGEYTLVGCSVAPGFDFADFSFLKDAPEHTHILKQQPYLQEYI